MSKTEQATAIDSRWYGEMFVNVEEFVCIH
jgi:hypothetical protein